MTEAQKRVHDAIAGGPRGGVRGPFGVLLRSLELADRAQKLGEHLRFNSTLPPPAQRVRHSHQRALVSMVLNVAKIPLPPGVASP